MLGPINRDALQFLSGLGRRLVETTGDGLLLYYSLIDNIAALRLDCKIYIKCRNTKY